MRPRHVTENGQLCRSCLSQQYRVWENTLMHLANAGDCIVPFYMHFGFDCSRISRSPHQIPLENRTNKRLNFFSIIFGGTYIRTTYSTAHKNNDIVILHITYSFSINSPQFVTSTDLIPASARVLHILHFAFLHPTRPATRSCRADDPQPTERDTECPGALLRSCDVRQRLFSTSRRPDSVFAVLPLDGFRFVRCGPEVVVAAFGMGVGDHGGVVGRTDQDTGNERTAAGRTICGKFWPREWFAEFP